MRIRLYHNPRCSKSRAALQLLRDAGVEPEIIEYLKTPPTAAELYAICTKLGMQPQALVRFKEDAARALGLKPTDQRPRREWLRLLAEHPVLIERPIAVKGRTARLGRPPEAVLELVRG
jgi:arsenate reductase